MNIEVVQKPKGEKQERVVESIVGIASRAEAKAVRRYLREKYGKDVDLRESGDKG